jgi:toluene monooxygenase system ferredoxin subunit
MKQVEIDGGHQVLLLNSEGRFFAYQAMCPHQEVALCEGLFDGRILTCHEHLWQWDAETGAPVGLAEAPLEFFDVLVEDGEVFVGVASALELASVFEGISEDAHAELSALMREQSYPAGAVIYDFGAPVEDLYILEKGRVEFLLGRDDRTSPGGFLISKGELFGWAALIADQPRRIAKATCEEESRVIALNGNEVRAILARHPTDGHRVMSNLVRLITRYLASFGAR